MYEKLDSMFKKKYFFKRKTPLKFLIEEAQRILEENSMKKLFLSLINNAERQKKSVKTIYGNHLYKNKTYLYRSPSILLDSSLNSMIHFYFSSTFFCLIQDIYIYLSTTLHTSSCGKKTYFEVQKMSLMSRSMRG